MSRLSDETKMFREVIVNAADDIGAKITSADFTLTPSLATQTLQILSYSLSDSALWDVNRKLLMNAAPKMRQAGYNNAWTVCLEKGIALSQKKRDDKTTAELLFQLGLLQQLQAYYDKARESMSQSLVLYKTLNDSPAQASIFNYFAFISRRQRNFSEAKELVQKVLDLLPENDLETEYSYFVLGSIAIDEGDGVAAEQYYRLSLEICQSHQKKRLVAQRYGAVGLALYHQSDYLEAISWFERAIPQLHETGDPLNAAIYCMNAGVANIKINELEKALAWFEKAAPGLQAAYDRLNIAKLALNKGVVYKIQERWIEAEGVLQNAIKQFSSIGNTEELINAYTELAAVYIQKKNYIAAVLKLENAEELLPLIKDDPLHSSLSAKVVEQLADIKKSIAK